ncbi:MAG: hypothetical protein QNL62_25635 [Gammaproteobacteria bacterium]|nr:hypothetical protein [Gammaproteobacteria bacterium]
MSAIDKEVNYSVVFMGELITGFDKQQVLKNLVNITRMPIEDIEQKFFNNGRVIIKRTSNLKKAKHYHGKFLRAGIAVGIQMDFE